MAKMERRWRGNRLTVFQYIKAAAKKDGMICSLCLRRLGHEAGAQLQLRRKNFLMVKIVVTCWHWQENAWSPLLEVIKNMSGMTQSEPSSLGADEFTL